MLFVRLLTSDIHIGDRNPMAAVAETGDSPQGASLDAMKRAFVKSRLTFRTALIILTKSNVGEVIVMLPFEDVTQTKEPHSPAYHCHR